MGGQGGGRGVDRWPREKGGWGGVVVGDKVRGLGIRVWLGGPGRGYYCYYDY